jgi:hypothetical protein
MNERIKELAEQAGYFFYDLTETHERKTIETDSVDEWVTLERFAELVRKDEREAGAKLCEEYFTPNLGREIAAAIRGRTE